MTEKKEYPVLETKWGRARVRNDGYYVITSTKEENHNKYLHILIWEEHHGKKVPKNYDIHHIDNVKTNNKISNLKCIKHNEHLRLHQKEKNTTGFLNVNKNKNKQLLQGFRYRYNYRVDGERITFMANDLDILQIKVKEAELPWEIVDMEKAKKTVEFEIDKFLRRADFLKEQKSSTGFFRVGKTKRKNPQGFFYRYLYTKSEKQQSISSVDLDTLQIKVEEAGLPWEIIDMEKAKKTVEFEVDKFLGCAEFQQKNNAKE